MPRTRHPKNHDVELLNPGPLLAEFLREYPKASRANWHDILAQMHRNHKAFMMQLDSQGHIQISIPKERR